MRIKLEHQNIFVVSDYHINHGNILKFDSRPYKDLNQMHEMLIHNWNSVVNDDSVVFYLGDLSFGKIDTAKWFVSQLKGKIYCVIGNHDDERELKKLNRFEAITDYIHLDVKDDNNKRKWQEIIMMHYPILQWNKGHYGAFHLHGHSHQSLVKKEDNWQFIMKSFLQYIPKEEKEYFKLLVEQKDYYSRKVLDVGCNGHNYTPLSYQQIKDIMETKGIEKVDHHE